MTTYTVMGVAGAPFRAPFGSFSGKVPVVSVVAPLFLSSTAGMMVGDKIQIMLNDGTLFTTTIKQIVTAGEILITNPLPYFASAGNIVIDLTQSKNVLPDNEDFLT